MKIEKKTGFWTFYCNPKKWEIDKFLGDNILEDTYSITEDQKLLFSKGQFGVLRVGVDRRNKKELGGRNKLEPGIYAIVEVVDKPKV